MRLRLIVSLLLPVLLLPLVASARQASASDDAAQAEILLKQGRIEEAIPLLLTVHHSRPRDWQIPNQLALAYTRVQQFEKAEEFYRTTLSLNPGFLPARKNRAVVLWFLNRRAEAEREFRAVEKLRPEDPVPHLYLALAAHARGQYPRAREHFEKAGELAFDNPEVAPVVAQTYLAAGRPLPARLLSQLENAATREPAKAALQLTLADAYDKQGMPEKAYAAYTRAIESNPRGEQAYIALASFASAHQNNDFALKVLGRGLEAIPGSSRLLLQRGVTLALQGKQDQAEDSFLKASQANPKWSLPLLALGISQLETGRAREAAATFRQAAAVAPGDYRAAYLHGTALIRTGDASRRTEAVTALRKAVSLAPNDPRPRASLGQALLSDGQLEEAVSQLEKALKSDPENSTALYQLGLAYRRQGKAEESRRLLERFQQVRRKERGSEGAAVQILKIVGDEK